MALGASIPADRGARLVWLDAARGIGIILVVYAHAARGLVKARLMPDGGFYAATDRLIYAFHMPLFFLISGLFIHGALGAGRVAFVRTRAISLLWPYLLWSVLQTGLSAASGGAANHQVGLGDLAMIWWLPIAQFWFLYALLLCQLVLLLPGRWTLAVVAIAGLIPVVLNGAGPMWLRALSNLPFFAAGYYLGAQVATNLLADRRNALLIGLIGWTVFAVSVAAPAGPGGIGWLRTWVSAFGGIAGTLALARLAGAAAGPLAVLGAASMAIYLTHSIIGAAVRIAGAHLGLGWGILLVLCTVTGLLLALPIERLAMRLGLGVWFGFGKRRVRPLEVPRANADVAISNH